MLREDRHHNTRRNNAAFIVYYEEVRYKDTRLEPQTPGLRAQQNGARREALAAIDELRAEVRSDKLVWTLGSVQTASREHSHCSVTESSAAPPPRRTLRRRHCAGER